MRVLALDPGDRVGWARADVAEDGTWTDLRHGITPLRDMALAVHSSLIEVRRNYSTYVSENDALPVPWERKYDVVVCEDWRLYPHMAKSMVGSSFPSAQFIGAVRLCCWLSGTKLVTQGAASMKPALKSMQACRPDLYELATRPVAHDDGHDQSALIHLFAWTFKNYDLRPAEAVL